MSVRKLAETGHDHALAALAAEDEAPKSPGWRLSPGAARSEVRERGIGPEAPPSIDARISA
jgi:hypothetical protein